VSAFEHGSYKLCHDRQGQSECPSQFGLRGQHPEQPRIIGKKSRIRKQNLPNGGAMLKHGETMLKHVVITLMIVYRWASAFSFLFLTFSSCSFFNLIWAQSIKLWVMSTLHWFSYQTHLTSYEWSNFLT
jgi:hypothetical protein